MCQYIHTIFTPCTHCTLELRICSAPKPLLAAITSCSATSQSSPDASSHARKSSTSQYQAPSGSATVPNITITASNPTFPLDGSLQPLGMHPVTSPKLPAPDMDILSTSGTQYQATKDEAIRAKTCQLIIHEPDILASSRGCPRCKRGEARDFTNSHHKSRSFADGAAHGQMMNVHGHGQGKGHGQVVTSPAPLWMLKTGTMGGSISDGSVGASHPHVAATTDIVTVTNSSTKERIDKATTAAVSTKHEDVEKSNVYTAPWKRAQAAMRQPAVIVPRILKREEHGNESQPLEPQGQQSHTGSSHACGSIDRNNKDGSEGVSGGWKKSQHRGTRGTEKSAKKTENTRP